MKLSFPVMRTSGPTALSSALREESSPWTGRAMSWSQGQAVKRFVMPPKVDAILLKKPLPVLTEAQKSASVYVRTRAIDKLKTLHAHPWDQRSTVAKLIGELKVMNSKRLLGEHVMPLTPELLLTAQGLAIQEVPVRMHPRAMFDENVAETLGDCWTEETPSKKYIPLPMAWKKEGVLRYLTRHNSVERSLMPSYIEKATEHAAHLFDSKTFYSAARDGLLLRQPVTGPKALSFEGFVAQLEGITFSDAHLVAAQQEQHNSVWHWLEVACRLQEGNQAQMAPIYCKFGTFGHYDNGPTANVMQWNFDRLNFNIEFNSKASR